MTLHALLTRVRTLLTAMPRPRATVEEPDAVATAEHYHDGDRLVIQDDDHPMAWIESDTHVPRDAIEDFDRARTPRRPYNTPDK